LHGIKGEAPLYVNLAMRHEDPALRTRFGSLQLQLIYFHWLKIETFREAHPDHVGEIREGRRRDPEEERDIKQADGAARAARSFQPRDLSTWLSSLDTTCDPEDFPGSLIESRPQGGDARTFHDRIELYCDARYLPGPGGAGGTRQRTVGQCLNLVDYMGRRYGMEFDVIGGGGERDDDDQKTLRQEHILGRRKPGAPHKHIDRKSIIKLGLEPLELADGDPAILENIPPKTTRHEAIEGARARSRGFEIDRRLFPFNSQAIRLQEFQDLIVPALKEIARDSSSSTENLVAAAAIAISAETGRSLKELLRLLIEPRLTLSFSFMPPKSDQIGQLRDMIGLSKVAAVQKLFAVPPVPFNGKELAKIEKEVLTSAPEGTDLIELLDLVRTIAAAAGTPTKVLARLRVAVEYPLPPNPFAEGLKRSEEMIMEATKWRDQADRIQADPAAAFLAFLFSTILELYLRHASLDSRGATNHLTSHDLGHAAFVSLWETGKR
jgi:hypothetical protein